MGIYNTHILPKLINWACSQNDITQTRKKIITLATGRVLEVGIGSGLNLPFYDPAKIEKIWGIDPSTRLKTVALKTASKMPFNVDFIGLSGEQIPLEKNTVDTIVVTYTLCSIPDVKKALLEMNRVLKSGGQLIFCEHGKAPDHQIRQWQDRINPIWIKFSGGCHLNRPISQLIEESGFKIKLLDTHYSHPIKPISFNYRGIAFN